MRQTDETERTQRIKQRLRSMQAEMQREIAELEQRWRAIEDVPVHPELARAFDEEVARRSAAASAPKPVIRGTWVRG